MKIQIEIKEHELIKLMQELPPRTPIDIDFGPGGIALTYDHTRPSLAFERLMLMRGVSNQNTEGAGI